MDQQKRPAFVNAHEKDYQHSINPFPIQLLVIDIDGTLLDPAHRITPRVRAAIHAARSQGVVVALASGRRYCVASTIADDLAIPLPLLVYDGAIVLDHPSHTLISANYLPASTAQNLLDILVEHRIQPLIHHFFASSAAEEMWTGPASFDTPWVQEQLHRFPQQVRRYPYSACCQGHPDPVRVLAYAPESMLTPLLPLLSTLPCSWNITTSHLQANAVLSIMNQHCSKASGLTALARALDIPLQHVMAIGDDNNDLEMLQCVGWSVAMGQSTPAIKSIAHSITTSNAEDGVAHAIDRYILSNTAL
jgi:5-amino-6-(5-phospho-D-ribitylamino)uracil phosphatase